MEVPGGKDHKLMVCIYELLGTSGIVYAVLVSGGNGIGVPLTVFALILMCDKITGAHFNPGVTTTVMVARGIGDNFKFAALIMISQFIGGLLGIFWAWLILMPSALIGDKHNIPQEWVPALCPVGVSERGIVTQGCDTDEDRGRATFFF